MIILGIDPSLNSCGCAILSYANSSFSVIYSCTIKSGKTSELYTKILEIHKAIKEMIQIYQPSIIALEETFVNNNPATSLKLGMVRGACYCACIDQANIKIVEYSPRLIKKTITGNGAAEKIQLQYMLKQIMPKFAPKTDDESDAAAVAITSHIMLSSKLQNT